MAECYESEHGEDCSPHCKRRDVVGSFSSAPGEVISGLAM